jgi:hypothetical protein
VALKRNNMKQTAVEWLHYVHKQRELDKFDWEQAKELEKDRMIEFHKWMIENDTVQNAEKHFHFTDSDMLNEYYNEI